MPLVANTCLSSTPSIAREASGSGPAGLPMPDDDIGRNKGLCCFHSRRSREDDLDLKPRLEQAVKRGDYLGDARLSGAKLMYADLSGANLEDIGAHNANLRSAIIGRLHQLNTEAHQAVTVSATLRRAGGGAWHCTDVAILDLHRAQVQSLMPYRSGQGCPSDNARKSGTKKTTA